MSPLFFGSTGHLNDPELRLQRQLLLARQTTFDDPDEAILLFNSLWPAIRKYLSTEEELAAAGFYLEALGRRPNDRARNTISDLVRDVLALYRHLIERQPSSSIRRRIRETHQRVIEGALAALLPSAEQKEKNGEAGQQALEDAWQPER